ncbi:MAG: hypothetical protein M1438_11165 [Deltaproteobacteria bacterium]|nr:hypothetical protein [Deltaproteobacteria bacterium]
MEIVKIVGFDHVSCFADRLIIEPEKERLHLASLFGTLARVTAIKAQLLTGKQVLIQRLDQKRGHQVERSQGPYQVLIKRLSPEVLHCLLFRADLFLPKSNGSDRIIVGNSRDEVLSRFFRLAQQHYTLPLLPAWTEWLWEQCEPEQLEAIGWQEAWTLCWPQDEELEAALMNDEDSPLHQEEPTKH